jgi:hypothetical protein
MAGEMGKRKRNSHRKWELVSEGEVTQGET